MESVLPICRVCLNASKDYFDLQARFECNDDCTEAMTEEINYLQCLSLCTNLSIEDNDGGPQCLCMGCEAELQIVYKFMQKARSSQAILEESLWSNDPNNEKIEHTEITIEAYGIPEIEDDASSPDNDPANDCTDFSSYTEFPSDCHDPNDLYEESRISDDCNNASIEENIENECEAPESFPQIESLSEDNITLQKNKRIFISKKYKCHICNRYYSTEHRLKVHLYYHKRRSVKSQPYSCKICGALFSLHRYLTQHMVEHQDCRETFKCQYCEKEYISKTALISHKRVHQADTLNCNECGKQFNGSYEFSVHLRFHKREKEQGGTKCHICYKEFSSARYLPQHMAVHLGSREKHGCTFCNKKYGSKTALSNHKRLHEGQTTDCNICGKKFTRNCELKIHMRFHKGEHPFKCTLCGKDFAIKGHLRTHMWLHQGIKIECDECGKLFGSTKALNEHSYTHGQMPYPCHFCDKAFPSKQKYKIHLEKIHCSEKNKIDVSQIKRLANTNTSNMRKKFTFVQIGKEEDTI